MQSDPDLARTATMPLSWRIALAVGFGWFCYVASCWLVPALPPDPSMPSGFEVDWQKMSEDPFAFPGRLPHRILAPLLAWLLGCGGAGWHDFTQGLHVVFLASVFFTAQHLRTTALDALLVTAMVAFTAPVQMYKQHWDGYTDPICYALFLWAMVAARNPYALWTLFLVNLFNHELAGFLVPWLWFLRRRQDARWRLDLGLFVAACAIYLVYYLVVKANVRQTFSVDYFVSHPLFPGGTFAVWNLAVVHLVTAVGPMLALLAWHQHARLPASLRAERWHLWLVALGVAVIFCIAFDWARHSHLIVLPLIVAAVRFLQSGGPSRSLFAGLLGVTLLLFWWVPPWTTTAWPTSLFANLKVLVATGLVIPLKQPGMLVGFGGLDAALGGWLPKVWKPLLVLHGIGLAIWTLGYALTRFVPPRQPQP